MKTWVGEMIVVAAILVMVNTITNHLLLPDIIAAIAVLLTFGHAQIGDRLAEKQSMLEKPTVKCYRRMLLYFIGKEVCWFAFFLMTQSYSALVGVVVFLFYPLWRKGYRRFQRWSGNDNCN